MNDIGPVLQVEAAARKGDWSEVVRVGQLMMLQKAEPVYNKMMENGWIEEIEKKFQKVFGRDPYPGKLNSGQVYFERCKIAQWMESVGKGPGPFKRDIHAVHSKMGSRIRNILYFTVGAGKGAETSRWEKMMDVAREERYQVEKAEMNQEVTGRAAGMTNKMGAPLTEVQQLEQEVVRMRQAFPNLPPEEKKTLLHEYQKKMNRLHELNKSPHEKALDIQKQS